MNLQVSPPRGDFPIPVLDKLALIGNRFIIKEDIYSMRKEEIGLKEFL